TVWIQKNPGVYEIRMVKTGISENDAIEITSGLTKGEVVVTSGAYLLNSEYIFKQGADPMAGMKM
ncbi:MAG: efflux RND transporter periplasmic adaptor subunit, partial [Ferruginibacter sp.]